MIIQITLNVYNSRLSYDSLLLFVNIIIAWVHAKRQAWVHVQNKRKHGYMFMQFANLQQHGYMLLYSHKQNNRATAKDENEVAKAYRRHQRNTG